MTLRTKLLGGKARTLKKETTIVVFGALSWHHHSICSQGMCNMYMKISARVSDILYLLLSFLIEKLVGKGSFNCPHCTRVYVKDISLQDHIQKHHTLPVADSGR